MIASSRLQNMTNERDKTASQLHFVLLKHCKAFPFFIYDTWMHPGNFPSKSVVIIEGIDIFFFNPVSSQHPQQAHYFWPELLTQRLALVERQSVSGTNCTMKGMFPSSPGKTLKERLFRCRRGNPLCRTVTAPMTRDSL